MYTLCTSIASYEADTKLGKSHQVEKRRGGGGVVVMVVAVELATEPCNQSWTHEVFFNIFINKK